MTEFQILQRAISNNVKIDPKIFKNPGIRLQAYEYFGITEDAIYDDYAGIVYQSINKFGYKEHLLTHKDENIRLSAKTEFGFTPEDINDGSEDIRNAAKRELNLFTTKDTKDKSKSTRIYAWLSLGFTSDAFNDPHYFIRLTAYLKLGFTEESMNDPCTEISKLAKRHFKYKYKNERGLKVFKAKYEVK